MPLASGKGRSIVDSKPRKTSGEGGGECGDVVLAPARLNPVPGEHSGDAAFLSDRACLPPLRLPMTCTRQMAQVSHSTSQLHMATAFHFFSENILSAPPALAPEEPEWEVEMPGSSPSSASAMAGGGRRRWRRRLGCPARLLRRSSASPAAPRQPAESQTTKRATLSPAAVESARPDLL